MNNYHDIHCPYCGSIIGPFDIKFSLSEFVGEIFNQRLDEKYNDGILGVIDTDEVNLILDNDFLWDMGAADIMDCRPEGAKDTFVLSGENLIKRFGFRAVELYNSVSEELIEEVAESRNINEAIQANDEVRELVGEIIKNIPHERLMRTEVESEDRDVAVLSLIRYAKSGKVLFKIDLKIEADKDDMGQTIHKDIRSSDDRIICKSKRCCECGNELSKMAGKYEEKVISFIGSPAAGKSAYLAAAINKLLNSGQSEYGIEVIFDYQSSDYIFFNETCLAPYSKGFAITKTNQGVFPQLSIALKNARLGKIYLYTFVDIPGETFIDEDGCDVSDLLANRRIIRHADAVWFCVSAKQLFSSKLRRGRRVKSDAGIENEEMNDLKILGQNTIRFASEMYEEGGKVPAVAIVLTKSDLLSEFIMTNVFAGELNKNRNLKKEYFRTICSAPQGRHDDFGEDYDYYDGEPNTLGYLYDGKLNHLKFVNGIKSIVEFIKTYGEPDSASFIGNVASAFRKTTCPCFSEASYGRNPVEKFSMEGAVRYLVTHKDRLQPIEYGDLIDIFGESELASFESGEGKLRVITDRDDILYIQDLYKRLNPVYPFGIMSVLEWTFAYTGFIQCTEFDGDSWKDIPVSGENFEILKTRLSLETDGGNIMTNESESKIDDRDTGHGGIWSIFGRKK